MSEHEVQQLVNLLHRYQVFSRQLRDNRLSELQAGFRRLQAGLAPIRREAEERERKTAGRFNIFHLLGMVEDETRTHSAFLAALLDPAGSHAQQHLFLETFIEMCTAKDVTFPIAAGDVSQHRWHVEREKLILGGRLDLVITSDSSGYRVAIENKITALEQENQMRRYGEWLATQRAHYPYQALIYLTPEGYSSNTAGPYPYYRLSYRQDIYRWLNTAVKRVEAPRVRHLVRQYTEIVRHLTSGGYVYEF